MIELDLENKRLTNSETGLEIDIPCSKGFEIDLDVQVIRSKGLENNFKIYLESIDKAVCDYEKMRQSFSTTFNLNENGSVENYGIFLEKGMIYDFAYALENEFNDFMEGYLLHKPYEAGRYNCSGYCYYDFEWQSVRFKIEDLELEEEDD